MAHIDAARAGDASRAAAAAITTAASGRSRSAASASSTATSAPARSTRCARPCWPRSAPAVRRAATVGARRAVADHLGADPRRHAEVRRDPAARRQQRRGRHAGADGAGAARARPSARRRRAARHHQRRAVLRRRHHHAGASVLSAVEGLKIATPAFDPYVVPITVVILIVLFAVQSRGTARVAAFFGPITLVWFVAIAVAGLWHIGAESGVLAAFNPIYGVALPGQPRPHRLRHARRRVPGGHRRRGALRRPRPFRPRADPRRLARRRAAGAGAQLSRPGRAGAGRSEGDREPVLPAVSRTGRCCRWWCSPPPRP